MGDIEGERQGGRGEADIEGERGGGDVKGEGQSRPRGEGRCGDGRCGR